MFGPAIGAREDFDLQGHRGARGLAPENTLSGFEIALELGVDTLELDTVISADGEVVVSHEPWMSAEICSHPDGRPVRPQEAMDLNIFQMPYGEVARFDCGIRGHVAFARQRPVPARKPLLREVIAFGERFSRERGRPPVHYNIETKSRREWEGVWCPSPGPFVEAVWSAISDGGVADRSIIQSFDVRTLQVAHSRALPLRLALLVEAGPRGVDAPPDPLIYLQKGLHLLGFDPDIYSPDYRLVSLTAIERAHDRGVRVIPWTVNGVHAMRHLLALGVDGLITDYPDLALRALDRKG